MLGEVGRVAGVGARELARAGVKLGREGRRTGAGGTRERGEEGRVEVREGGVDAGLEGSGVQGGVGVRSGRGGGWVGLSAGW